VLASGATEILAFLCLSLAQIKGTVGGLGLIGATGASRWRCSP